MILTGYETELGEKISRQTLEPEDQVTTHDRPAARSDHSSLGGYCSSSFRGLMVPKIKSETDVGVDSSYSTCSFS